MVAPTLTSPPTLARPEGAAWLFDSFPAVVTQLHRPAMDLEAARFLAGPLHEVISARYFSGPRKILFVHDWRACDSYSIDAREELLRWGRLGAHVTDQTIVFLSPNASPFVRIALHTGAMVMRRLGMRFSVLDEVGATLAPFADQPCVRLD